MKSSVLYYSKTGYTKKMAERIAEGMNAVEGMQAKAISIEEVDEQWIKESKCIVIGTPTYYTGYAASVHTFIEKMAQYELAGKLCGAFASADFLYGGAELAMQAILTQMMFYGMMAYSGGMAHGMPPIHLGPVCLSGHSEEPENVVFMYGQRMAEKAVELF